MKVGKEAQYLLWNLAISTLHRNLFLSQKWNKQHFYDKNKHENPHQLL